MPKGEKNRKLSDDDRAEAVRIYTTLNPDHTWTGVTTIARRFNVRNGTIQRILKLAGVKMRTPKEAHIGMIFPHEHRYSSNGDGEPKRGVKRCKPIKNFPTSEAPLCKCGCGQSVEWVSRRNRWDTYVTGHRTPDRPYKHRDWLYNAYVTERRSVENIAAQFNVAYTSVRICMRRFGIELRSAIDAHKGIHAGDKNPAWKGGTTPERQRLYKKGEWKELVREVLKRDNYTCQRCNTYRATNKPKLVTHHIKPFAGHPELRFDPDNLVTLCEACHVWVHSRANSDNEFC